MAALPGACPDTRRNANRTRVAGASAVPPGGGLLRRAGFAGLFVGVGVGHEAELLELAVERRAVVVEDLGGLLDVAAGAFERLRDGLALDLFHRHVGRDDAAGVGGGRGV